MYRCRETEIINPCVPVTWVQKVTNWDNFISCTFSLIFLVPTLDYFCSSSQSWVVMTLSCHLVAAYHSLKVTKALENIIKNKGGEIGSYCSLVVGFLGLMRKF